MNRSFYRLVSSSGRGVSTNQTPGPYLLRNGYTEVLLLRGWWGKSGHPKWDTNTVSPINMTPELHVHETASSPKYKFLDQIFYLNPSYLSPPSISTKNHHRLTTPIPKGFYPISYSYLNDSNSSRSLSLLNLFHFFLGFNQVFVYKDFFSVYTVYGFTISFFFWHSKGWTFNYIIK